MQRLLVLWKSGDVLLQGEARLASSAELQLRCDQVPGYGLIRLKVWEPLEVLLDPSGLPGAKPKLELGVDQLDQDSGPAYRVQRQIIFDRPAALPPARPPRSVP